MDSELKFEKEIDGVKVRVELEAADTLGVLLRRVDVESMKRPKDVPAALRKQAAAIVERLAYIEELKVIEVDGVAHAVQIRSAKPSAEGFTEVILRGGHSISVERRGSALHISKKTFTRLLDDLANSGSDV